LFGKGYSCESAETLV